MDNTVTTGAGSGVTSGLKVLKYLFWCIICPLVQFFSPFRRRTLTLGPRGVRLREVRLVFQIFRILEYSVYSAIPFCQSVSAPFVQIWSPLCLPIFRNVTEIVKNMVWGDAVPKGRHLLPSAKLTWRHLISGEHLRFTRRLPIVKTNIADDLLWVHVCPADYLCFSVHIKQGPDFFQ